MHMFIEITLGLSAAAAAISACLFVWAYVSRNVGGAGLAAALTISFILTHIIAKAFS